MAANLFDKLSPKAAFLSTLLTNVGLNVAELVEKNDANALKAHIDGIAKGEDKAALTTAIDTATHELRSEVATLEQKLTTAEANAGKFTTFLASVEAAGVKLGAKTEAADVKAAVDLHTATAARNMVAKAGHPGLLDDPALDPANQKRADDKSRDKAKNEGLTGRDRMAAAFNVEIAHNKTNDRRRN